MNNDDDAQMQQESDDNFWEDMMYDEWEFFDEAFESWNALGETEPMGEDEE